MPDDVEERLLAQIAANPADDGPRAVYADHLLSRGSERGEYISLALADERGELSLDLSIKYRELDRRSTQWETELGCHAAGFQLVRWRRGFPEILCVNLGPSGRARQIAALLHRLPFRGLLLRHDSPDGADIAELAAAPELARLEWLAIHGPLVRGGNSWVWSEVPASTLEALAASPHLTSIRRFECEEASLTDRGAAILRRAPWLAQLEELHITQTPLTGDGLAQLLDGDRSRLRELRIWAAPIGDGGARAIDHAELPALASLTLGQTGLTPAGGRTLLASRNLARVVLLDLRHNNLALALAALATSPYPAALEELVLEHAFVRAEDATALASARALGALTTLKLSNTASATMAPPHSPRRRPCRA